MIHLTQDNDGYVRMSRHFPAKTTVSITFNDGTSAEYSGQRMNGIYDEALAAFRLGNNLDAKGFDRNAKNIHRRNAVDHVPVHAGMEP
ncbi:hypothetical protein JOF48_003483 [Arthrobacter stackebrandtii]|uniref:Uncharacterized protein n=1 Tax=Arthrobacter stackebrandtii TaxID=272161 RepID=A0ABS4Z0V6_9MICC|nr:hypothetical protein [Arthrobacter stackebrandtii]MBP2414684.1 hypothetical protein [Arthrobacter stackebrandtii]PYH01775.1 hypothetical protein CVV67_04805 [Arthrobacter stackebrandtii]